MFRPDCDDHQNRLMIIDAPNALLTVRKHKKRRRDCTFSNIAKFVTWRRFPTFRGYFGETLDVSCRHE